MTVVTVEHKVSSDAGVRVFALLVSFRCQFDRDQNCL